MFVVTTCATECLFLDVDAFILPKTLADVVDLKSQCVQLNVLSFMWMLSCCLKLADVVDL